MRGFIYFFIFISLSCSQAQGTFLPLPVGARQAALGGWNISSLDGDLSLVIDNPALLDSVTDQAFSIIYSPFLSDIQRAGFLLAITEKIKIPLFFGVVGNHYGTFDERDLTGVKTGEWTVSDVSLSMGTSLRSGPFSLGIHTKYYILNFPSIHYQSFTLHMGGHYTNTSGKIQIGLLVQQIGFSRGDVENISTEIVPTANLGITLSPQYMPFRFVFTLFDMGRSFREGYTIPENTGTVDRLMQYLNLGIEIPLGEKVELSGGYNHLRREELRLVEGAFGAGLSLGVLVKTKKWYYRVSRMTYHAAGGSFTFSISSNFKKLFEKY